MPILQKFFGNKGSRGNKSKGKTCPSCGEINPLDAKFCSTCGGEFHIVPDSFDAFISYRRETGSDLASLLKIQLENRFHKAIFLDVNELQVGRFDEELLNRIENTPNFIIILTRASLDRCANKSDWLKREIMQAIKTGRNIIPVMTEGFTFPSDELWALLPSEMRVLTSLNAVIYSHIHQDSAIRKIASYIKSEGDKLGIQHTPNIEEDVESIPSGKSAGKENSEESLRRQNDTITENKSADKTSSVRPMIETPSVISGAVKNDANSTKLGNIKIIPLPNESESIDSVKIGRITINML